MRLLPRPHRPLVAAAAALAALCATPAGAGAAANPAGCAHELRTSSGAIDSAGLCVSYGYGVAPAGVSSPTTKNVVAYAEGTTAMPFDYYVRSDIAQQIAAGTAVRKPAYLLLYGGAFICGSRADVSAQARELARRGYVAIAAEYPLAGALNAYGYYRPNAGYSQAAPTTSGANSCNGFSSWIKTPAWKTGFQPRLKARGLEAALQQDQWVLQSLVRTLKTSPSYGVDPKRIWSLGVSAGGAVAVRLAFSGNNDRLPSGVDPGDSTIAGAISISGPTCFAGSRQVTEPMLLGQFRPSEMPACRLDLDATDPPVVMIQEPRGGADDPYVPSALMLAGCNAINAAGFGRKCIYEDRAPAAGGYVPPGTHANVSWADWLRMFDVLAAQTVGQP